MTSQSDHCHMAALEVVCNISNYQCRLNIELSRHESWRQLQYKTQSGMFWKTGRFWMTMLYFDFFCWNWNKDVLNTVILGATIMTFGHFFCSKQQLQDVKMLFSSYSETSIRRTAFIGTTHNIDVPRPFLEQTLWIQIVREQPLWHYDDYNIMTQARKLSPSDPGFRPLRDGFDFYIFVWNSDMSKKWHGVMEEVFLIAIIQ